MARVRNRAVHNPTSGALTAGKKRRRITESHPNCHRESESDPTEGREEGGAGAETAGGDGLEKRGGREHAQAEAQAAKAPQ